MFIKNQQSREKKRRNRGTTPPPCSTHLSVFPTAPLSQPSAVHRLPTPTPRALYALVDLSHSTFETIFPKRSVNWNPRLTSRTCPVHTSAAEVNDARRLRQSRSVGLAVAASCCCHTPAAASGGRMTDRWAACTGMTDRWSACTGTTDRWAAWTAK